MPTNDEICARLETLVTDIRSDRGNPNGAPNVKKGDNLPALIEASTGYAVFAVPADFTIDAPADWTISKPCAIVSTALAMPAARVSDKLVGPTIRGSVRLAAPGVTLQGLRLLGTARDKDRALVQAGEKSVISACLLDGGAGGVRRGVLANAAGVTVKESAIINVFHSEDAQAVIGWDGTKDLRVLNSLLEASGENVMFGGGDPASEARTPQDILISGCTMSKPLAWRGKAGVTVKNLFELKNAKRVRLEDSELLNCWGGQGQSGYAITLTVRNQDGRAPYSTIEDVEIARCRISNAASGVQILGRDDSKPSGRMARVTLRANRFEQLDPRGLTGAGHQVFIAAGPLALAILENSFTGASLNSFLSFDGPQYKCDALMVEGNTAQEGDYGIFGSDAPGLGRTALDMYAPGALWRRNKITRGSSGRWIWYPEGTDLAAA